MNEPDRESLSALMDGEASEIELHRILRASEADSAVAATWQRWHIARSALRGRQESAFPRVDLREAIASRIDSDVAIPAASLRPGLALIRPLASMAIAASVAALAVFAWLGLPAIGGGEPAGSPSVVMASAGASAVVAPAAGSVPAQTVALAPVVMVRADGEELVLPEDSAAPPTAAQDRLNAYFTRHAQAASATSARGLAPFARVVSLEGEQAP